MSVPFSDVNLNNVRKDVRTNASNISVSEQALSNMNSVVVSNTNSITTLNSAVVRLSESQDITGEKRFTTRAKSIAPVADDDLVIKEYVDKFKGFNAFSGATNSTLPTGSSSKVYWDTIVKSNPTIDNTGTTTTYVVDTKGIYHISCFFYSLGSSSYPKYFQVIRERSSVEKKVTGLYDQSTGFNVAGCSCLEELLVGDELFVRNYTGSFNLRGSGTSDSDDKFNGFSAILIKET